MTLVLAIYIVLENQRKSVNTGAFPSKGVLAAAMTQLTAKLMIP